MDKAQAEHLKKNKHLYELIQSDGWKLVRARLVDKIADLQSISNVEGITPEDVFLDIKVRINVADILLEWLKETEGEASQYESNEFPSEIGEMLHIIRAEDE